MQSRNNSAFCDFPTNPTESQAMNLKRGFSFKIVFPLWMKISKQRHTTSNGENIKFLFVSNSITKPVCTVISIQHTSYRSVPIYKRYIGNSYFNNCPQSLSLLDHCIIALFLHKLALGSQTLYCQSIICPVSVYYWLFCNDLLLRSSWRGEILQQFGDKLVYFTLNNLSWDAWPSKRKQYMSTGTMENIAAANMSLKGI